ncbi:hypothetical protein U1Q18_003642 [Sarracenia purpurea var. burkii]
METRYRKRRRFSPFGVHDGGLCEEGGVHDGEALGVTRGGRHDEGLVHLGARKRGWKVVRMRGLARKGVFSELWFVKRRLDEKARGMLRFGFRRCGMERI